MNTRSILDRNGVVKGALVVLLWGALFAFIQKTDAQKPNDPSNTLSRQDQTFLKEAAQGNMEEAQLGKLAQQKATNPDVKKFAERMVADHGRLESETKALAEQKRFALSANQSGDERSTYAKLSKMSGNNFDKNYISDMVKDHEHDIAAFQKEVNQGADQDVKNAASKALPTLQEHLKLARQAAQQLGLSVS